MFLISVPFAAVLSTSQAYALGVGVAQLRSYIGQPLLVEIPLFSVAAPNTLAVSIEGSDSVSALTASLSRANSQLTVLIGSASAMNEPYLNFSIKLVDQGNEFQKEFTILLDLSPKAPPTALQSSGVGDAPVSSLPSALSANAVNSATHSSSVMGPYDWAVAGAVPEKFGAVLDGQSLWRVARRINKAMDVSISQMMWGLYQQNPKAFASSNIKSLQAGSYLTIPSHAVLVAVSDARAKQLIDRSVKPRGQAGIVKQVDPQPSEAVGYLPALAESVDDERETEAQHQQNPETKVDSVASTSFQLTGIDNMVTTDGNLSAAAGKQAEEIVASLSQTVGSLTEQLVLKDKQIDALEVQVGELKNFIRYTQAVPLAVPAVEPVPVQAALTQSRLSWFMLLLGLMGMVAWFIRERFVPFWEAVTLKGEKGEVEFRQSEFVADVVQGYIEPKVTSSEQPEDTLMKTVELADEEIAFAERFAMLLGKGEYDFAEQLLEIARGRDVSDEEYHYHRLQLMAAANEEDAFYEYYVGIESEIPTFTGALQTQISKLVVHLAQH